MVGLIGCVQGGEGGAQGPGTDVTGPGGGAGGGGGGAADDQDLRSFFPLEVGNVWAFDYDAGTSWMAGGPAPGSGGSSDVGTAVLRVVSADGDAYTLEFSEPGHTGLDTFVIEATQRAIYQDGDAHVDLDDIEEVYALIVGNRISTMQFGGQTLTLSSDEQDGCYGCTIAGVQIWSDEESRSTEQVFQSGVGWSKLRSSWRDEQVDFTMSGHRDMDLVAHRLHEDGVVVDESGDVDWALVEAGLVSYDWDEPERWPQECVPTEADGTYTARPLENEHSGHAPWEVDVTVDGGILSSIDGVDCAMEPATGPPHPGLGCTRTYACGADACTFSVHIEQVGGTSAWVLEAERTSACPTYQGGWWMLSGA